jgi:hypothetical protein
LGSTQSSIQTTSKAKRSKRETDLRLVPILIMHLDTIVIKRKLSIFLYVHYSVYSNGTGQQISTSSR